MIAVVSDFHPPLSMIFLIGIPCSSKSINVSVLKKLRACFEDHGIEFTGDPLVNPGVTLHISKEI